MVKTKDSKFYTELIITTVLSLVSASLWIAWTKGMVRIYFDNHPTALLGIAICTTLLAIFCLQYMVKHHRGHTHKENIDKENIDKESEYTIHHGHPMEH